MFSGCSNLEKIDGIKKIYSQNQFDTLGMFAGCYKYEPDDYYEIKESNITWRYYNSGLLEVTGTGDLYQSYACDANDDCVDFEPYWNGYQPYIKQAKIDVRGITRLSMLFKDCTQLEQIDLSKLDTSEVEDVDYMFSNCPNLKYGKDTLKLPDTIDTTLLYSNYFTEKDFSAY